MEEEEEEEAEEEDIKEGDDDSMEESEEVEEEESENDPNYIEPAERTGAKFEYVEPPKHALFTSLNCHVWAESRITLSKMVAEATERQQV